MDASKKDFLTNQFLEMSVVGALQRSRTYCPASDDDERKGRFRIALQQKLVAMADRYRSTVGDREHLENLTELADHLTSRFSQDLLKGRFRIGIAQKALNFYLKYLWCADLIPEPPHCPFDSTVIGRLPNPRGLNWTEFDTIEDYETLVEEARIVAAGATLARWELEVFNHR